MDDALNVKGWLTIKDEDGNVLVDKQNLVVNGGLAFLANALVAASSSPFTHIAVGSGTTAASAGQTALVTELGRVPFTYTGAGSSVTLTAAFNAGVATGTWSEAGIFNAASAGTMYARTTFGAITKSTSTVYIVTWVLSVS
jgi:hypothetical protein